MARADVTCWGNQCTNATDTAGALLVYRRIASLVLITWLLVFGTSVGYSTFFDSYNKAIHWLSLSSRQTDHFFTQLGLCKHALKYDHSKTEAEISTHISIRLPPYPISYLQLKYVHITVHVLNCLLLCALLSILRKPYINLWVVRPLYVNFVASRGKKCLPCLLSRLYM